MPVVLKSATHLVLPWEKDSFDNREVLQQKIALRFSNKTRDALANSQLNSSHQLTGGFLKKRAVVESHSMRGNKSMCINAQFMVHLVVYKRIFFKMDPREGASIGPASRCNFMH